MSELPETPAPGADEPAALVPDDATAVHPAGGEPTDTEPTDTESTPPIVPPAPSGPVVPVTPAPEPPAWTPPAPPQDSSGASGPAAAAVAADRPEVAVGAAFAGGLVLALILKRLAH